MNINQYTNSLDGCTMQLRPLVIFGTGGHAVSVANVALSAGYAINCFVDKNPRLSNFLGYDIISHIDHLDDIEDFSFAIAIGDNAVRELVLKELTASHHNLHFPVLIHSAAVVSNFCVIKEGTVVMPGAIVGPNSNVGKFCLINTQASIDHDCEMLDYSSLAPGAVTGGSVKIGTRSAICIGAVIKNGVQISYDCVVGAHSYLNDDLSNNQVAYGSPAKQVRKRETGEPYLK